MFFTDHVTVYTFWSCPKYYVFVLVYQYFVSILQFPNIGCVETIQARNTVMKQKKNEIQYLVPPFDKENTIIFKQRINKTVRQN